MSFPYRYICDLLQELDDDIRRPSRKQKAPDTIVKSWFQQHRSLLNESRQDACAILSMLLPERRTDRVYNIQAPKLQSIFGKALRLGISRVAELRRWTEPGSGIDLADCVECVLRKTPNSRDDTTHLTVREIDEVLGCIAAACRFSSPTVRALRQTPSSHGTDVDTHTLLTRIYTRLGSRDAKWFTRLVLKNYQPVVLNVYNILSNYHPVLPQIMKIRDDLTTAIAYLPYPNDKSEAPGTLTELPKPFLGTKVGRQNWFKARSIKHGIGMLQGRDAICEEKIDGEYCQIHIDLSKSRVKGQIQIFSKSGKDSTSDRINLHKAIRDSLKIGCKDCPITTGCILEGELVVYSTKEHKILPFHKIRKHVSRSGSFLGTTNDSQPHEHEHLMIIYYDALLIDNESLLGLKNSERFRRLSEIITCRKGYTDLVTRTTIHTSRPSAAAALRELFAQCISSRGEGLVVKPDEPYFDFSSSFRRFGCCNIKLKKEYIQGLGDVGDFAVVGASYDPAKAREYKLPNVKWTHFFIGCLQNEQQARAKTETPRFRVTNVVELTGPTLVAFWDQQTPISVPYDDNMAFRLDYGGNPLAKKPIVIFPCPLVFDMQCFSFDKEPNTNYWSMRFPAVSKIHNDRSYLDTITFSELQEVAEAAVRAPEEEDSQEMRQWLRVLEKIDRGKFPTDTTSQSTTRSDALCSYSPPTSSHHTIQQPRHELPMPKPSSIAIGSAGAGPISSTAPVLTGTKRTATGEPEAERTRKRRRQHSNPLPVNSPRDNTSPGAPAHKQHREPLGQVELNTVDNNRVGSVLPSISTQDNKFPLAEQSSVSSPVAYYTASERISSSPTQPTQSRPSSLITRSQSDTAQPNSGCLIEGHKCPLASCSVLLSPCISSYAYVTEDLLKRHGITDPLFDPRVWKTTGPWDDTAGDTDSPTPTPSSGDNNPGRKRRLRKICLVESKRKEATRAFVQKIRDADVKSRGNKRAWITIYDWRVLEVITEQETQTTSPLRGTDPWRKFYVGIA